MSLFGSHSNPAGMRWGTHLIGEAREGPWLDKVKGPRSDAPELGPPVAPSSVISVRYAA